MLLLCFFKVKSVVAIKRPSGAPAHVHDSIETRMIYKFCMFVLQHSAEARLRVQMKAKPCHSLGMVYQKGHVLTTLQKHRPPAVEAGSPVVEPGVPVLRVNALECKNI